MDVLPRTVHLCPACESWQLDYTGEELLAALPIPAGSFVPPAVAVGMASALVDELLLEHLRECFGLPT